MQNSTTEFLKPRQIDVDTLSTTRAKVSMQPFERGETARTTQGSGLGLAIVSRIAHLHNGVVIARNQTDATLPNRGLLVRVVIPIVEQSAS